MRTLSHAVRRGAIGFALALIVVFPSSGSASTGAQLVVSAGGLYAQGHVPDFPVNGGTRWFSVTLAQPSATLIATPAPGTADISRPWVALTETVMSDPASANTTVGNTVCSQFVNPSSIDAGSLQTGSMPTYGGVYADVTCPGDGSGYQFYRVRWDAAPLWPLVQNQATSLWMGGEVQTWSAGGASGQVELWPQATQVATFQVCGYRAGTTLRAAGFDCFGESSGTGSVVPVTGGMLSQLSAG